MKKIVALLCVAAMLLTFVACATGDNGDTADAVITTAMADVNWLPESAKKEYYNNTLAHFSPSERRLINPHYYKVDISDDLYNLKMSIITRLVKEIREFSLNK